MRRTFALFALVLLASPSLRAGSLEEAVRSADAARVRATIAGDVVGLEPLLSETLRYAYADGRVETKAELLATVKAARIRYEAYDYGSVRITRISDEAATMSGRARLRATSGGVRVEYVLSFLSVWRREGGGWRLVAYQSARLTEPALIK